MGNWYKCREIIEARNPEDRAREERVPVQEQSSPLGKKMESRGREWGAVETGNKPLPSPMGGGEMYVQAILLPVWGCEKLVQGQHMSRPGG